VPHPSRRDWFQPPGGGGGGGRGEVGTIWLETGPRAGGVGAPTWGGGREGKKGLHDFATAILLIYHMMRVMI
jgi:hypothetical protein